MKSPSKPVVPTIQKPKNLEPVPGNNPVKDSRTAMSPQTKKFFDTVRGKK